MEVNVPFGESGRSTTKIKTEGLGPCIAFVLSFKYKGKYNAILIHYNHSIQRTCTSEIINDLIQIIDYIRSVVSLHYETQDILNETSNFDLLVTGGDEKNGQWIHDSLKLLNMKLIVPIQTICVNILIQFLCNQLTGHVTIIKFVFKMLPRNEEEGNDIDEDEYDNVDEDQEEEEDEGDDQKENENDDNKSKM